MTFASPLKANASVFDDNHIISTDPNEIKRGNLPNVHLQNGGTGEVILPHSYSIVADPTNKAPTRKVERFELRHRDYWENEGQADKHRIEVGPGLGSVQYGDEHLYEWNFFIEDDFLQGFDDTCHIFGNVHDFSDVHRYQTSHMLTLHGYRRNVFRLSTTIFNGRSREIHTLSPYAELVGRWVNFKWHVKWSEEGFHRYWIDGSFRYEYRGFTLSSRTPTDTARINYGLYRNRVLEWEQLNGKPEQTKRMLVSDYKQSNVS
jgi:hypothetical protein